jgi:hypothetical protein
MTMQNVRTQPLIPVQIVSPHPWRRIFIGCIQRQGDVPPEQLWLYFGLDEKSRKPKNLCHLHPIRSQLVSDDAVFNLIPDTIPEVLSKGIALRLAALEFAMQHFEPDVCKTYNELRKEQDEWRYAESKRKWTSSGPFLSGEGSKKARFVKRHSGGDEDDYELYYDDTAIQKLWYDFGKRGGGWVNLRMAELIQNRFGTATTPPEAVVGGMRNYGKHTGDRNPDRVFNFHGWKSWIDNDLEVVKKTASLRIIDKDTRPNVEELRVVSRLRQTEDSAVEAATTEATNVTGHAGDLGDNM